MRYPTYDSYKESQHDWLGKLPNHWGKFSIKRKFNIINGSTPKSGESEYWDGDLIWVTPADFSKQKQGYLSKSDRQITQAGLESCGTTLVKENSIILSTRAPIGEVVQAADELCTNQGCKSLVVDAPEIFERFYFYSLKVSSEQLNILGLGTTFMELSKDALGYYPVAFPPIEEQQKIAAFLDYKTQQIDQLIAKKKTLIEKLEEKRIAVITQAVTKGLDKNVTLKPSGMDWLGDVPDHWLSSSLRWLGKRYAGGTPDKSKDEYWVGGTIPWLNSGAVNQGDINTPSAFITEEAYNSSSTKWVPESAIVLALAGQGKTKGTAAYMKINATCNQSMAAIVFDDKYYSRFMYWWLVSQYKNIRGMASDDGRDGLNLEMIGSIPCPIPTLDEQVEIAFYIDEFEKKRKKILEKLNSAVEKLDEYRSAIITSAVTGKIDVRNVGIPREAA